MKSAEKPHRGRSRSWVLTDKDLAAIGASPSRPAEPPLLGTERERPGVALAARKLAVALAVDPGVRALYHSEFADQGLILVSAAELAEIFAFIHYSGAWSVCSECDRYGVVASLLSADDRDAAQWLGLPLLVTHDEDQLCQSGCRSSDDRVYSHRLG